MHLASSSCSAARPAVPKNSTPDRSTTSLRVWNVWRIAYVANPGAVAASSSPFTVITAADCGIHRVVKVAKGPPLGVIGAFGGVTGIVTPSVGIHVFDLWRMPTGGGSSARNVVDASSGCELNLL